MLESKKDEIFTMNPGGNFFYQIFHLTAPSRYFFMLDFTMLITNHEFLHEQTNCMTILFSCTFRNDKYRKYIIMF